MITVTQRSTGGSDREARATLTAAARVAAEEVAGYWHQNFMPRHFTVEGGKYYGYQPRKGDNEPPRIPGRSGNLVSNQHYSWRKRRKQHHNKPLVWSGQSERQARQQVRLSSRVRDGHVIAAAVMDLPTYFYQYRTDLGQPDKVNELTRTTPDEVSQLTAVYQAAFTRALSSTSGAATTERLV